MNARARECDHRRIDVFLDANCVGLEDDQLLKHLNICTACREYMERRAADSDSWRSAAEHLQPGEFDHASSDECSLATIGSGRLSPPAAIRSVLDLLSPSEEPTRLGRLGTYEVSGVIGAGGMGVVLKAVDPALDRVVAIKVLSPHLAHSGTARRRFSREAKAAAAVLHPNVIPIHSVSSDEKIPYLVMAYIRGGSLQKRLDREGPLSTVEILRIGSQVAAGLAAAHEQGLVHRDVKPENILLEEGVERVTLTDFGLARAVDDASVTQPGTIAGTPQYMSPEQTRGEPIDQQSDLFSLGCVLYALCTGRPPFRADSSYAVMRKISDESPMPIRELNPDIPEWLCAMIDKLMAKKKVDRFQSAHEVHLLLETCLGHVQQPTATKLPEIPRLQPTKYQRLTTRILIGVLSMSAVVACVLFGLSFLGGGAQEKTGDQEEQAMQSGQVASKPADLKDGDYLLRITQTARHPSVRFPTDEIPESEYRKVDEPVSVLQFSNNLKSLKLDGFGGVGALESRAGDTLVYTLSDGLDASGGPPAQVIVKQTATGLTATLTQFGSGVPVIISHKGTLQERTEVQGPTQSADGSQLTWKSLFGQEPPEGYPTDALTLIAALNNGRGEWVFAGKIRKGDAESEFEASMEIQGGFKKMIRQDSFPQWQVAITWPTQEPTDRLVLNIMALPEPTGIRWMLSPQYSAKDGTPIRGSHPMYEGTWNSETSSITWMSKRMRAPLKKEEPAQEAEEPATLPSTFQMVLKKNGEISMTGYQHHDTLSFSGQSAARVGEPYVETGPAIPQLPGGYRIFFASRLEVYLEAPARYEGAGPRIEKIGCEGKYIFGLVAPHAKMDPRDAPGYFWLDSETGKIVKGMDIAAWREALKSKGVNEPRLFGPEEVGEE